MSYCLKLLFDDEHGGDRDIRWWQSRMKKLDDHYGSLISTGKDATDLIRRQCKAYEPMLMRSQSSKIFILLIMICCKGTCTFGGIHFSSLVVFNLINTEYPLL